MAGGEGWSFRNGEALLNGGDLVGDSGITADGGFYTCYIAGEDLAAGACVYLPTTGTADVVLKTPVGGDRPIGFVSESALSGKTVKVVHSGRVAAIGTTTPTKGLIAVVSATVAGTVDGTNVPGATTHWQECGHFTGNSKVVEGVTLVFVQTHFN